MQQRLRQVNGWLVFLFFALAVTSPAGDGYAYAPALLLLIGLAFCPVVIRRLPAADFRDKWIIAALALFFLAHLPEILLDDQSLRALDRPSRFLLAIPALLLLLACPPKPGFFWWGAISGSTAAGLITILQKWLTGGDAVSAWMMPIQFAAIASVLAWVSFAATGYFRSMNNLPGMLAGVIGGASGLIAVALSGTRGAWLVIPVAGLILALAYRRAFTARIRTGALLLLLLMLVALAGVSQTSVRQGAIQAGTDVQRWIESGDVRSSPGARLEMWKNALDMIPDRPWLGWGRNGYREELQRRVDAGETSDYLLRYSHAHSELIDAQVKRGLPGLLALLAIYLVPAFWFLQRALGASDLKVRAAGLAGAFLPLVFFFSGLTQALFAHNSGVTFYAFMLVIAWANMRALERA